MNNRGIFIDIIAESNNVNDLPTMDELYKLMEERIDDRKILDDEYEIMADNWDSTIVTLKDGSEIELVYYTGKCVQHSSRDYDGEHQYKVADDLYLCASCHAFCKMHKDLVIQNYDYGVEGWLFPIEWKEPGIISWIRKRNENKKNYFEKQRHSFYDDEYYEDFDDEPEFDNLKDLMAYEENLIKEEKRLAKESAERKQIRGNAWGSRECQEYYKKILEHIPSWNKTSAKDIAINCFLNKKEPDYENLKLKAETKRAKKLRKKKKRKEQLNII